MIYCRCCGKKIAEGVRSCPYCGTVNKKDVQGQAETGSQANVRKNRRAHTAADSRTLAGLFVFVSVILLMIAGRIAWELLPEKHAGQSVAETESLRLPAERMTDTVQNETSRVQAAGVPDADASAGERAEPGAAGNKAEQSAAVSKAEQSTAASEAEQSAAASKAEQAAAGNETEHSPAEEGTEPGAAASKAEQAAEGNVTDSTAVKDEIPASSVLDITRSSASSVRAFDVQAYDAFYVLDNDGSTAWSEGVPGYGVGEYIEFGIPAGTVITGGEIQPGFYKSEDLFYRNGAPLTLIISSGSNSCQADVSAYASAWKGRDSICRFTLSDRVVSDGTVRVAVGGYRAGTQYDDTMISELRLTGYVPEGEDAQPMAGIEPESEIADSLSMKTDVRANALMTYGALRAKYGREASMVHGLHWNLQVPGLAYDIEFMASGFSAEGNVCVSDEDTVWHVAGQLGTLFNGCKGPFSPEAFADALRTFCEDVSWTQEDGAGTGYYLSDRYAVFTFMDAQGQYWSLEADLSSQETITQETCVWLGRMN